MKPAILFEGVRRRFGGKEVLSGVSGEVAAGSVVGLLARNGEGKTTLMRIAVDLLSADAGRVEVLGLVPDGSGDIRGQVGWVPERPVFHEFLKVSEVFALRRKLFPGWDEGRQKELCRELDLDENLPVRGASKGTLGKIAWVCAAAHNPRLLILDEPTSGLDALAREGLLRSLIGKIHETGAAVLAANHRMDEIADLLDEVWCLKGGLIAESYPAQALRAQARRVSGRPRPGKAPAGLRARKLEGEGPVAEWAVFREKDERALLDSGHLDNAVSERLPLETTLKLLLKD